MEIHEKINARQINIVDADGKAVIQIGATRSPEGAYIEMIGSRERILLQVLEDGRVALALDAPPKVGVVTISTNGIMILPNFTVPVPQKSDSGPNVDAPN